MYNIFDNKLMAIIPSYSKGIGNVSTIYRYKENDRILKKSVKSTIHTIGKLYAIDISSLKTRYENTISATNLLPIPLDFSNILIPIKTRTPIYKNDGAFSYVNLKFIKTIEKDRDKSRIILKDGRIIRSVSSYNSTFKHYMDGVSMRDQLSTTIKENCSPYNLENLNDFFDMVLKFCK